eukprot:6180836-Pleurochrysis_carterae.AAC.1
MSTSRTTCPGPRRSPAPRSRASFRRRACRPCATIATSCFQRTLRRATSRRRRRTTKSLSFTAERQSPRPPPSCRVRARYGSCDWSCWHRLVALANGFVSSNLPVGADFWSRAVFCPLRRGSGGEAASHRGSLCIACDSTRLDFLLFAEANQERTQRLFHSFILNAFCNPLPSLITRA